MTDSAPLALRIPLLAVLLIVGGSQLTAGLLGLTCRLHRRTPIGVRTEATMRSEDTFQLANKIAGLPLVVGGLVAVAGAALQFVMRDTVTTVLVAVIALLGATAISTAGARRGHRAAADLPVPSAGCGSCGCGSAGCAATAPGGAGTPAA